MNDYDVDLYISNRASPLFRAMAGRRGDTWFEVSGDDLPTPVFVRLEVSPSGSLVCTGLVLGHRQRFHGEEPVEISSRLLRQLPIGQIVAAVADRANDDDAIGGAIGWHVERLREYPVPPSRPGRRGHPREHYERVAEDYRESLVANPSAPTKTLAARRHVSEPTLRRWLQRARELGLLGEAPPGRAGESK